MNTNSFPPLRIGKAIVFTILFVMTSTWALTEPLIRSNEAWPGTYGVDGIFTYYIPDSVDVLRFIIFRHQAPLWGDSPDHDITCMALASKCCFIRVPEGDMMTESNVSSFLTSLADQTGHPELPYLPIMSDGETNDMPKDHLCSLFGNRFFAHYGWTSKANYTGSCPNMVPFMIPEEGNKRDGFGGRFSSGSKDKPQIKLRNYGWPHGYYGKKSVLWPLFETLVQLRVPKDWDPTSGPGNFKDIVIPSEGQWYGIPDQAAGTWPEIYTRSDYPEDITRGVWLPNEDFAYVWRAKAARHPEDRQADQGEGNFATMSNGSLSGQPQLQITTPARPYHSKLAGGKKYPLYPLNASIDVTFKNGFYDGSISFDAVRFNIYDGKHLLKTVDAIEGRRTYVVRNCILRNTGPRSLIVIAELKDGNKATSRPVPVYVTDLFTADPADTLRPKEHEPVPFKDGILNPNLLATTIGTEVPSWNWKMSPTVRGGYDESGTYHLEGNGHAVYMCWDRAGFAHIANGVDGDFVFMGRLANIPESGPGTVGLTVKGAVDGISPVLDLRYDYYWQENHPDGVALSWLNRHTPARMIGTHDQGQRGDCEGYPVERQETDTVCVFTMGCLGRGFENQVPGFTSREDLWLAVKRVGTKFYLYARYGKDSEWTKIDPTPKDDGNNAPAAIEYWPDFFVPPSQGTKVYPGFTVVGVQDGQHIMTADIDNIALLTSTESVRDFPNYIVSVNPASLKPQATRVQAVAFNTSSGLLTIHPDVAEVKIFSVDGRQVMKFTKESSQAMVKVPVTMSPGVYLLRYAGALNGVLKLQVQ